MSAAENAVAFAFLLTNIGRVLAYLPQILAIARDTGCANAVPCSTWILFFAANLSSTLYAGLLSADLVMTVAFATNTACCAIIVVLLCWKRRMARKGLAAPSFLTPRATSTSTASGSGR